MMSPSFMGQGNIGLSGLATGMTLVGESFTKFFKAHPVATIMGVTAAVTGVVSAIQAYNEAQRKSAQEAAESWTEENDSLNDYKDRIEELGKSLESGRLSDSEAADAKEELLSIQKELNETYQDQADGIDLVNGSYEKQLELIDEMAAGNAETELKDNSRQIDKATNKIEGFNATLGQVTAAERDDFNDVISGYEDNFAAIANSDNTAFTIEFKANAEDVNDILGDVKTRINDLQKETDDENFLQGIYEGSNDAINSAAKTLDKWQEIYDTALEQRIVSDMEKYASSDMGDAEGKTIAEWLSDYAEAADNYNEALESGNASEISKARGEFEAIDSQIREISENTKYDYTRAIDEIANALDSAAVNYQNFKDILKGTREEDENTEHLKRMADGLSTVNMNEDLFRQRVAESRAAGDENLFTHMADAADAYGLSLNDLCDVLVEVGVLTKGTQRSFESSGSAFQDLINDEESGLKDSITDIRSQVSDYNDAISDVVNGEETDLVDMMLNYGVSGNEETLVSELTQKELKAVKDFVKGYNEDISGIKSPEELEEAQRVLDDVLSSMDLSGVDFSNFEDVSADILKNALAYTEGPTDRAVQQLVWESAFEKYGGSEAAFEILYRLSLDPDSSDITSKEIDEAIEKGYGKAARDLSGTMQGIFENSLGDETEFSGKVDTFQSDIESINSALDDLRNGEEVNVMDLVQDFPELANSLDNLEEGLSNLSIQKAQQFAKDWKEAFSDIGEEDMDAVNKLFNETIADVDMSSVINKSTDALERYNDVVAEARSAGIEDVTETMVGNIDTDSRQVIKWTDDMIAANKEAIESWDMSIDTLGEYSTALGMSDAFNINGEEVEIAFTPMLQTENGAKLLDSKTVSQYIATLTQGLGEDWTVEDILAKDAKGISINGERISNLIAGVGDDAIVAGQAMHYLGDEGAIALEAMNNEVRDFALENMMNNMLEGTGGSALTHQADLLRDQFGDVLDEVFAEYGTDQYAVEAIARLSLNPQAANWDFDEWKAQIENEEVYVKINMYEDSIAQLENNLDLLETSAERVQNEMDRNDIYARQNGEQMYRDLINNGNLQLQNLESQLAYWQAIAAESDTTGTAYADALSQIQSIESEINTVLSNQQEWNAAAEALKYEAGDLLSEYSDATSTRNGGDSYSEILSALDATNELVEEGKWGVDEAQAGLKLASAAGIADITNWEQNYAHMQRYFTEDATGISNALSDLTEATNSAGEALATYDEATGDWLVNISNPQDLEEAAQAWGINTEAAYALFSTLSDYGFTTTYLESEADGVYQLGQAYADLAQEEYKLNQMRKDSDKYSAEDMQAQQEVVDEAKQTVQDVQSALGSLDESYIEENQEMAYGELLSMLNGLPEAAEAGSGTMSAYLDGMKQFADEHGLDTSDLFVTDSNGNLLLSKDGYEAMAASYGEFAEEMTLNAEDTGSKFGNALVNSMGETVDEEGTTIQDMAQSIADTFSSDELGQIEFDTGQYTEGVEEAEMAVDGLLTALGLTQAEGEQAVEFLQALQEGDWETALDIVTNAEEVEGELEDYFYDEEIEAKVKPKVEEALGEYTPEELLGIEDDEEFAATVGIDYDSDGAQQEINEARREIEGEEIQQKINTVVENNEEIESAEDLLNLSPEELEVEFEPVLDGTGLEMSDIESYLGYEEPEIPVTVKMDDAQFEQLTTPEEQEIPVTFKVDGDAAGEIQSALDAVDATVTAHIEFENEGTDLMTGVTETGEISVPGVVNFEVGEMPEGEEITATGIVNYQVGEVPESIDATATGTVNYEVGTTPTSVDAKATGTIDYKAGSVENPTEAAEGIINYTLGEVAIPEGQTASGVINYTLGNVAEPSGKTVTGTINYNLGSVAQPSSVDYSVGSAPSTVDNATGLVDYSVGDYPATVPDAQGVANYILGSYPTTVPSVTSTANFVLGSYPTSVPSVTQTVFQNVVSSGGTASSHDSSAYWSGHGSVLGTAHASGTVPNMNAYSGGRWLNWSLLQNEDALVNETGKPESIVRDGKWQLIKGGAHVESLKRGDIVLLNAHLSGNRWMYSI